MAEGKKGGLVRWACLLPPCPGWVSLRAPWIPPSPQVALPFAALGRHASLIPFPTGTLWLLFSQAQDPAHSHQNG